MIPTRCNIEKYRLVMTAEALKSKDVRSIIKENWGMSSYMRTRIRYEVGTWLALETTQL